MPLYKGFPRVLFIDRLWVEQTSADNMHLKRKWPVKLLLSLLTLFSFSVFWVALLLLMVSHFLCSIFFALSVSLISSISGWWAFAKGKPRILPPSLFPTLTLLLLALSLGILSKIHAPPGICENRRKGLVSIYQTRSFASRFSPAWLVEESDQIRLGSALLPYLDPFTDKTQAKNFVKTFNSIYAELNNSREFYDAGSVLGEAYGDMFFLSRSFGHCYVYYPSVSSSEEKLPVLVFLHGWLGNMKAYVWAWSRFAEQNGFVVVCPTFKNGVWKGPDAEKALLQIDTMIRNNPVCDSNRIIVVGLSNGGTGVVKWATTLPESYCALVLLSPVMRGVDSDEFVSAVGDHSILVVHGGQDNRIPPDYVNEKIGRMKAKGLNVQSICYPEEDHVLLLSARNRLHGDLISWLTAHCQQKTGLPQNL
jgi:dienelactone hydrolase